MRIRPITEGPAETRPMARGAYGSYMGDDIKWRELCQHIMSEKDPEKLWALVDELNKELEQRERQLRSEQGQPEQPKRPGED